jgi:ABC-type Fe3+/spermidine/putrescine transport system ATPase subunit
MVGTAGPHTVAINGASIRIVDLEKRFGYLKAVSNFNIDIQPGEFISVLGASGSGKTTVLRMLAGLEEPSGGQILIDGRDTVGLPPEERNIGLVFQDYALFPHMSVRDNVAFPLKMRGSKKQERVRAVDNILSMVGASHLADRRPNQLSGGQQQRVALARALIFGPKLLLLDEPLSALDKNLREHMKAEIKSLHRRTGVTVIYVTHDQSEALALSDRIIVMRDGRILDIDEPNRLYRLPSSSYLAGFIGDANLIDVRILNVGPEQTTVMSELGAVDVPAEQVRFSERRPGAAAVLVVRPENIIVEPPPALGHLLRVRCRIEEMLYNGAHTIYRLNSVDASLKLLARCGEHQIGTFQQDAEVEVGLRADRSVLVPDDQAVVA